MAGRLTREYEQRQYSWDGEVPDDALWGIWDCRDEMQRWAGWWFAAGQEEEMQDDADGLGRSGFELAVVAVRDTEFGRAGEAVKQSGF